MRKDKFYSKKAKSLFKNKTSILSLLEEFREKFITDNRRWGQTIKPRQIKLRLARKILEEIFGFYIGSSEDIVRVLFTMDRNKFKFINISFGTMMDTDPWGDNVDEWERLIDLPVILYIAATYPKFTFEILQSHLEEVRILHSEFNLIFGEKEYIEVVKRYNKKLPDNIKLWLEFNH
jgi:hypothetical protein